ncbi:hypothetical protein IMCC9480_44 [Oxalobacteraceae bacterium IMCC9480]|nr:hypothetical protein IMCC9480_44 [Oxalobacteraceae bacterium IMCC9480]
MARLDALLAIRQERRGSPIKARNSSMLNRLASRIRIRMVPVTGRRPSRISAISATEIWSAFDSSASLCKCSFCLSALSSLFASYWW